MKVPAFAAAAMGVFMATLDGSIVNVALPTLSQEMGASVGAVQWVVIAYLLAATATLLNFGRLSDIVGRRATYVGGLFGFAAGSALCAAAPSIGWLVAARVVQGLGGAALMANGPAIVTGAFPPAQRGRALGMFGTVVSLGLICGPPLGGLILSLASWRWIFLVNLPVAALGVALALRGIPAGTAGKARLDPAASVLLSLGIASLLLGLSEHGEGSLPRGALLGGAAVVLAGWVAAERRSAHPVVDLSLFESAAFSGACLAALLSFAGLFAVYVLMPFYLTGALALAPGQMGLVLTAVPLAMAVASPFAGWIADRVGTRVPAVTGAVVLAAGLAAVALAGPRASMAAIVGRLFLVGLGTGLFSSANSSALMGAAPPERLGSASGMLAMSRNLGMALGAAIAASVFAARYQALTGGIYEHGKPGDAASLAAAFAAPAWIGVALACGAALSAFATAPRSTRAPSPP